MIRSVLAGFLFLLVVADNASAQSCTVPNTLTNGTNADATQVMANFNALLTCLNNQPPTGVPRSYLAGLTLSTPGGSAGFGIALGVATSDDATTSMNLTASSTKTTSAWAVGSGNGSLDTGSIANNTWYHVFLIERTDTAVVDVLISQSPTSPTLPTSYTKKRRIGSMKTNGSAQWTSFTQNGDEFLWSLPVADLSGFALTTTAVSKPLSVPPGVIVNALVEADFTNSAGAGSVCLVYPPAIGVQVASVPSGNWTHLNLVANQFVGATLNIRTDTSQQISAVGSSAANNQLYFITLGWIDRRGRDS